MEFSPVCCVEVLFGLVSPLQHIFLSLLSFLIFGCWKSAISQWYCVLRQSIKQPNGALHTAYTSLAYLFLLIFTMWTFISLPFYRWENCGLETWWCGQVGRSLVLRYIMTLMCVSICKGLGGTDRIECARELCWHWEVSVNMESCRILSPKSHSGPTLCIHCPWANTCLSFYSLFHTDLEGKFTIILAYGKFALCNSMRFLKLQYDYLNKTLVSFADLHNAL